MKIFSVGPVFLEIYDFKGTWENTNTKGKSLLKSSRLWLVRFVKAFSNLHRFCSVTCAAALRIARA